MKKLSLPFAAIVALVSSDLAAANSVFTWNGGSSGSWQDSANWLCDNAATDRWPGQGHRSFDVDPNNIDEVRFDGVTAAITLTDKTCVKAFVLVNGADVTITSDATKRSLFVYPGGMSVTGSTLTFDAVTVYHTTNGRGNCKTLALTAFWSVVRHETRLSQAIRLSLPSPVGSSPFPGGGSCAAP